ncbi:hypothetical protein [Gluconacetobacter takamatsuzukensis]|uniref:Uncharacterized protein n=1 Tax=Gluconacetobacter takamatsuzukensis TaxID=1286190 RepID=A0A7W4PPM0_9PROT|nr:hypothetical protein [Gluconacetobacter takamatsuzukensis]MBB2205585.1 hypothetical protein [Gluconacetobacter takamatsuzukensis]
MASHPIGMTHIPPSIDSAPRSKPSAPKARKAMQAVIRYLVAFAFSIFPWMFIASYMVISISISLLYVNAAHR